MLNANAVSVGVKAAAYEQIILPSGLTVAVRPMSGYACAHAAITSRFGSIDRHFSFGEREVKLPAGVAHFLEHKMFEDADGDALMKFAATGANANAYTSFDRTSYLFTAAENITESLDVLLEMVTHSYFTQQTIDKEQGIIGQEIKMYDDSPDWKLASALLECLYHSHPIRSDIAGTCESIAEITPQMLYSCCEAFYSPDNMILSAAGNITAEQVTAACKKHGLYEPREQSAVKRLWDEEPLTAAQSEKTIYMPVAKPWLGVGFKEKPLPADDIRTEALCDLILSCVCGGMSPLYRRFYDEGLADPSFGGEALQVDGCFCVMFTGECDEPETVRRLLLEEIARVRAEGVDRDIFTLAKNEKYGRLLENLENPEYSSMQMTEAALCRNTVAGALENLASLTAEDADELLQSILSAERAATVYIRPNGEGATEETEE